MWSRAKWPASLARPASRQRVVRCACFNTETVERVDGRNKLKLSFKVPYRTAFGQSLRVVGSDEYLGNWVPTQGRAMGWNPNDEWTVEFECVAGSALTLEYKYVVCDKHGAPVRWKEGSNLAVNVPLVADAGLRAESVVVRDAWDGSLQDVEVQLVRAANGAAAATSSTAAAPLAAALVEQAAEQERAEQRAAELAAASGSASDAELMRQQAASEMSLAIRAVQASLNDAYSIVSASSDPASLDLLAADRQVAIAARQVLLLSRTLPPAAGESLQLPGAGPAGTSPDAATEDGPAA